MISQLFADYTYSYNYNTSTSHSGGGAAFVVALLIALVFAVIAIVALWKLFVKAGRPGWLTIIPVYNIWILAEIGGKPGWWAILEFIPVVNWVISILIALGVARNFGKGAAFGIFGLWLFPVIGYLILGFGSAEYEPIDGPSNPSKPARPTSPPSSITPPPQPKPPVKRPPRLIQ